MTKKTLKARDIERLENTSFASVLIGGIGLPVPVDIELLGETTGNCSYSCPNECTCGCESKLCCATNECGELLEGSKNCPETSDCRTGFIDVRAPPPLLP